jgi:hypothetical protein
MAGEVKRKPGVAGDEEDFAICFARELNSGAEKKIRGGASFHEWKPRLKKINHDP